VPPEPVGTAPILFDVNLVEPVYIVPRSDGGIAIGATSSPHDEELGWRREDEQLLLQRAARYLPWVSEARITHRWTGLRPKSDSGYPWVGQLADSAGIWAVTGMHRNGILWGPTLARAVVDLLAGREVKLPESFTRE